MDNISLYITVMAMITFFVRYAFFSNTIKINLNKKAIKLLTFTAPSILTAMWAPIIFGNINQIEKIPENPFLISGLMTIIISLIVKNTLITVILSILIFILLKSLL